MSCKPGERGGSHLVHDVVIALIATLVFVLLSLPAHWSFDSPSESGASWVAHFGVGIVLCVYVLLAFLRATRILLGHEHDEEVPNEPS